MRWGDQLLIDVSKVCISGFFAEVIKDENGPLPADSGNVRDLLDSGSPDSFDTAESLQ